MEDNKRIEDASAGDLKRFLKAKNVDTTDCIEKSELVVKVKATLDKEGLKDSDFNAWKKGEEEAEALAKELDALKLEKGLTELSLEGLARALKSGTFKNIIVMTGAGLSVAAGIPDFRTPGTGLYDNLQKYNLPFPEAVFDIKFFSKNPQPFYTLAKELYPGNFSPTTCHHFIGFLAKKGLLLRNFTQNIDTLERVADIPAELIVEAHGSFSISHCLTCKKEHSQEFVKEAVFKNEIPKCSASGCTGLVKPDIVFFGEGLPPRFFECTRSDFPKCDLLLVMGTSLVVHPFAGLVRYVEDEVPRVLINRDPVGGFQFNIPLEEGGRDIKCLGDCQETVLRIAELAGWKDEFAAYIAEYKARHPEQEKEKAEERKEGEEKVDEKAAEDAEKEGGKL